MELLNKSISGAKERPVKILQFGEGNFLRGFVDYMVDIANEKGVFDGSVAIVKPIAYGSLSMFHEQENQYTVMLRGKEDGREKVETRVITSIADAVDCIGEYEKYAAYAACETLRFVVSNTTEAGIVYDETDCFDALPPKTYPGKLTKFLYERYEHFNGAMDKGLVMIPCELIEDNGGNLKKCVLQFANLWNLSEEFVSWIENACVFCSTLVDRIVTGYPREEAPALWEQLGYQDNLLDTAEVFGLWVIESDKDISEEFPLPKAGLPVIYTDNQQPYRERKVRILNGAHTSFVLASYLAGNDYVKESMEDEDIRTFMMATVFDEIIPTLSLPKEELVAFANAVIERFENPFIKHALLSISLNSTSKWKSRCMPSLEGYIEKNGNIPSHLAFSLAALMSFYTGTELRESALLGHRNGEEYRILDDAAALQFFAEHSGKDSFAFAKAILSNTAFFGKDLTQYNGLTEQVAGYLDDIRTLGMREAVRKVNNV